MRDDYYLIQPNPYADWYLHWYLFFWYLFCLDTYPWQELSETYVLLNPFCRWSIAKLSICRMPVFCWIRQQNLNFLYVCFFLHWSFDKFSYVKNTVRIVQFQEINFWRQISEFFENVPKICFAWWMVAAAFSKSIQNDSFFFSDALLRRTKRVTWLCVTTEKLWKNLKILCVLAIRTRPRDREHSGWYTIMRLQ